MQFFDFLMMLEPIIIGLGLAEILTAREASTTAPSRADLTTPHGLENVA